MIVKSTLSVSNESSSLLSLIPTIYQIETLRTIRIVSSIRVFRSVSGTNPPNDAHAWIFLTGASLCAMCLGLKALGDAIVYSLPALFDVMLLILFLFLIYGLVGLQTWLGEFSQRCFDRILIRHLFRCSLSVYWLLSLTIPFSNIHGTCGIS